MERTAARTDQSVLDRLVTKLLAPVDASGLVAFRIGFGLIMAGWAADYLISGYALALYQPDRFHFTYYLFDFVRPWPGTGMAWHFAGLLLLALCIAAGLIYRLATVLFALGFLYVFLLDRTNYQNHYYLIALLSGTLALSPLNRWAAVDVLLGLARPVDTVPAWCLWLLRFHIALPYSFGGVAKFHADWLAGEPLRTQLLSKAGLPVVGPLLSSEVTIAIFAWGGLFFDLAIVPLLLWRPTRRWAYLACVAFHLTNAVLFQIHIFPWLMMLATTIFFAPDWPLRLWGGDRRGLYTAPPQPWKTLAWPSRWTGILLIAYCLLQLLIPLRCHLYPGDSIWTERGHHFSWRMMLRTKSSAVRYYVTDPKTGRTGAVDLRRFVTLAQLPSFSRDPEMILQLAHHLGEEFHRQTGRDAEVRALVLTTLNGRKPELLIDPQVDLTREPRGFHFRRWILPQREPLRKVAWSVPMPEWERHVEIPPLKFLEPKQPTGSAAPPRPTISVRSANDEHDI